MNFSGTSPILARQQSPPPVWIRQFSLPHQTPFARGQKSRINEDPDPIKNRNSARAHRMPDNLFL